MIELKYIIIVSHQVSILILLKIRKENSIFYNLIKKICLNIGEDIFIKIIPVIKYLLKFYFSQ